MNSKSSVTTSGSVLFCSSLIRLFWIQLPLIRHLLCSFFVIASVRVLRLELLIYSQPYILLSSSRQTRESAIATTRLSR
jgi:hypothetical protein